MSDETALTFPQQVHDSLAELRQIALEAKSRADPRLRWATPEELALAESQRKDWHCNGHSSRTGLPCRQKRVHGAAVCRKHGGAIGRVKAKAAQRLASMVDPVLGRLYELSLQDQHKPSAVNAGRDLLDRAGIGELVEAKVRSSRGTDGSGGIVVKIGFLQAPAEPRAITVQPKPVEPKE